MRKGRKEKGERRGKRKGRDRENELYVVVLEDEDFMVLR